MIYRAVLAFSVVAMVSPTPATGLQNGVATGESISYRFENDRFLISRISLVVVGLSGKIEFSRQGLAVPITRDVRITQSTAIAIRERLDRLDFLGSTEVYQTKDDHSNLGTTTIKVVRGQTDRTVSFNYTANREMSEISSLLRGIANREIVTFDIETAIQFQPLELPRLLDSLSSELRLGRVTDAELLAPLVEEIADDSTLPLIARNKARKLIDTVRSFRGN